MTRFALSLYSNKNRLFSHRINTKFNNNHMVWPFWLTLHRHRMMQKGLSDLYVKLAERAQQGRTRYVYTAADTRVAAAFEKRRFWCLHKNWTYFPYHHHHHWHTLVYISSSINSLGVYGTHNHRPLHLWETVGKSSFLFSDSVGAFSEITSKY